MKSHLILAVLTVLTVLSGANLIASDKEKTAANARAKRADWPQWRGPARDDISQETGLLKKWPEGGPKRVWLFEDAGSGYSGPAIADGRLFTIGTQGDMDGGDEILIALDADKGTVLWKTPVGTILKNGWGNGPRGTPTVVGDRVYAMGGQGDLVCADVKSGKVQWQKNMARDFKGKRPNWGYTESVFVDGEQLICCPGGQGASVVALNKDTGATIWQAGDLDRNVHYSSVIKIDSPPTYVKLTVSELAGIDAGTGDVRWRIPFPGRTAVVPTPIYHDGHVFICAGYGVGCKLVSVKGGKAKEVYFNKNMKNHHGGVLLLKDHLYGYSDGVGWACMDYMSGEVVWREKKALGKGAVTFADGRLYCVDERQGTVVLADASPNGWNELGRFVLSPQSTIRSSRGKIWTHPVVCNGKLYLRDQEFVYCYDIQSP